jgi:hypothetical protein
MADRASAVVWADATGRSRLTIIKAATNPCTILNQLAAVSNAFPLSNFDGTIDPPIGGPAVAAQYQAVNQWVRLVFQTGLSKQVGLTLPAPVASIFQADLQTVDPATIPALIAACVGNLSDGNGTVATAYLSGMLMPSRSDLSPIG